MQNKPTRRAGRILARAFRNEVPNVGHQNVTAKPARSARLCDTGAARTLIAREPNHPAPSLGERRRARDHFTKRDAVFEPFF